MHSSGDCCLHVVQEIIALVCISSLLYPIIGSNGLLDSDHIFFNLQRFAVANFPVLADVV